MNHLEAQDLLPAGQHGFRKCRSTLTQLLSHWAQVLDHLEKGQTVDFIYIDFPKAFDNCETNVLLPEVKACQVKGRVGLWLAAFVDPSTRKQAVGVDNRISSLVPVVSGVPQGDSARTNSLPHTHSKYWLQPISKHLLLLICR